ncbi:MAG: hypothetical protein D3924_12385 [Candidatus Electrothrix sp. AR4]|nr:hypothetical protein [Candidatus Electrothrix sp. AR4]
MRPPENLAFVLVLSFFLLNACAKISTEAVDFPQRDRQTLHKFAYANCLFQYFKKKGYSLEDIQAISGGYLETSSIPAKTFHDITQHVKLYAPDIRSKHNIDPSLYKCFFLENSEELNKLISNW